jgi:hypothetical protein
VAGGNGAHLGKDAPRRQDRPEVEHLVEGPGVDGEGKTGDAQEGLDFGGEIEAVPMAAGEQRTDAETVPGQQQPLFAVVPEGNGELPVELVEKTFAKILVEVDQNLGVGAGAESVTAVRELPAQFR